LNSGNNQEQQTSQSQRKTWSQQHKNTLKNLDLV
jgi:hypothetical protein